MNPKSKFKEIWKSLASVQTSKNTGYIYTIYVNRPLGRIMAVFAYKLGLSANLLSLSGFFLTLAGLLYLVVCGYKTIWGTILGVFILLFAFDDADGQLARLTNTDKPSGEWLDHTLDIFKMQLLFLSIFLIILKSNPNIENWLMFFLLLPGVFSSGKFFSTEMKKQLLYNRGKKYDKWNVSSNRWAKFLLPLDYGFLCMIFLLAPFDLLLPGYLVWSLGYILFCILSLIRSFMQLNRSI